jgi:hypothetical protein
MSEMTLAEARALVEAGRDEGVHCLCCGQMCKNYTRPLNAPMARSLIWLVRYSQAKADKWVDLAAEAPAFVHKSRELAKLKKWGLIEEKPSESKRGARTSGIWRPTERGIKYARGEIALSSHVVLYDNHVLEFSKKPTTIRKSLGKRFDFDELWRGRL